MPINIRTEHHSAALGAPYDLYFDLNKTIPMEQLFLFESLSGPKEKRKFSLLGCHKLVEFAFFENEIHVTGEDAPCNLVINNLLESELITHKSENIYCIAPKHDFWAFLKKLNSAFHITNPSDDAPNFGTGFLSTFGYDFAWRIENLPKVIPETNHEADLTLAFFQSVISVNNETQTATQTSNHLECEHSVLAPIKPYSNEAVVYETPKPLAFSAKDTISKEMYLNWVEDGLENIRAGNIYQVQLGHEIIIDTPTPVSTVYQNLRTQNPSPYMFLCQAADQMLIGSSPEVHIRLEGDKFTMRPIAGTIKRGATPEEDAKLVKQLENDPKERAEHLMLIDLCRNDMGRVCKTGTLDVDKIMVIEKYSHVSHLVSNATATLKDEYDIYDAMRASFPAGTMSGAPKVRAMELIESMEKSRRGYYAGAIGFIDFKGDAQLALMIRMATYKNNQYRIRASAGVVIDSVPEKEWLETMGKMSALYKAITDKELKNENLTH